MGIPTTGNISIKGAAGSGRSIDAEVTSVSSGSLVTLSTNAVSHNNVTSAPYGMREFEGYTHTLTMPYSYSETAEHSSSSWAVKMYESDTYPYMGYARTDFEIRAYRSSASGNWVFQIRETGGTGTYHPKTGSNQSMTLNSWYTIGTLSTSSTFVPDSIQLVQSHGTWSPAYVDMWPDGGIDEGGSEENSLSSPGTDKTISGSHGLGNAYSFKHKYWGQREEGWGSVNYDKYDTYSFKFKKSGYYDYTTTSFRVWTRHNYIRQN